ncbi:MAG: DNA-processing protein DprA [Myxococcota bacterium]|nr:DNA-processing protein DprA [Myxococcota bacterium]
MVNDPRFCRLVDAEQRTLHRRQARIVTPQHPCWGTRRRPMGVLRYQGTISPASRVGIVGARRANAYGLSLARRIASRVVSGGGVVVSGGAYGIDIESHRAAMDGGGKTFVVLGSGLNYQAPAKHRIDFERACSDGALLSPFPSEQRPARWTYVARNEWIAGLSDHVIVVQAGIQSGALHTARFALEMGRFVWAVPGAFDDDLHRGCHKLIKEGASILTSDTPWHGGLPTLDATVPILGEAQHKPTQHAHIWEQLTTTPISLDALSRRVSHPLPVLLGALSELEIAGWVQRTPYGLISRAWPQPADEMSALSPARE